MTFTEVLEHFRLKAKGMVALALLPLVASALVSLGWMVNQPHFELFGRLALGVVGGVAFVLGGWRGVLGAVVYAAVTFVLSDLLVFGQLGDYYHYHYPQVLLMEEGWNPVFQPTMAAVRDGLGVDLETFRPVHTACFPLLLAQWAAVVDVITGSLCGFVWAVFLCLPAVVWLSWRTLERWSVLGEQPYWVRGVGCLAIVAAGARADYVWARQRTVPVASTSSQVTMS